MLHEGWMFPFHAFHLVAADSCRALTGSSAIATAGNVFNQQIEHNEIACISTGWLLHVNCQQLHQQAKRASPVLKSMYAPIKEKMCKLGPCKACRCTLRIIHTSLLPCQDQAA